MSSTTFASNLTELAPYVLGKKFTGEAKKVPRVPIEAINDFANKLAEDNIAKVYFDGVDIAKDFYEIMTDFKKFVPKEYQDEVFYAVKNGHYYKQIPAFCEYIIRKSWEKSNGIPNMILKIIPIQALKTFCQSEYFLGGLSLKDVICNICSENFEPVTFYKPFNRHSFTEIYIPSTDMVAAVPNTLADCLSENSVSSITVTPEGLKLGNVLLRTMAGYVGAVNSIYDLRELI